MALYICESPVSSDLLKSQNDTVQTAFHSLMISEDDDHGTKALSSASKWISGSRWCTDILGSPPSDMIGLLSNIRSEGTRLDAPGRSSWSVPSRSLGPNCPQWGGRKRLWEALLPLSWPLFTKKRPTSRDRCLHDHYLKGSTAISTWPCLQIDGPSILLPT